MNDEYIIKQFSDRMLNLKDEGLYGVNPCAEDLSDEMKKRIQAEATINTAYFLALAKLDLILKGLNPEDILPVLNIRRIAQKSRRLHDYISQEGNYLNSSVAGIVPLRKVSQENKTPLPEGTLTKPRILQELFKFGRKYFQGISTRLCNPALKLTDSTLYGVNPYDRDNDKTVAKRVIAEAISNRAYFIALVRFTMTHMQVKPGSDDEPLEKTKRRAWRTAYENFKRNCQSGMNGITNMSTLITSAWEVHFGDILVLEISAEIGPKPIDQQEEPRVIFFATPLERKEPAVGVERLLYQGLSGLKHPEGDTTLHFGSMLWTPEPIGYRFMRKVGKKYAKRIGRRQPSKRGFFKTAKPATHEEPVQPAFKALL